MTALATQASAKPKRTRRWAKRPANPNDEFPNASLSVMDTQLIIRELEGYEKRIAVFKDRASKSEQRHVRELIEKLYQVRRSPVLKSDDTADAESQDTSHVIHLSGNAPLEIFPFVTPLHREVVLRHKDDESQDIELTPAEADQVGDLLRTAAAAARMAKVDA